MASKGYQDLLVWQSALVLSESTYRVTTRLPDHERYGLSSQMRRAAVAIPANIAEGQGRNTCRALLNHLSIARARSMNWRLTLSLLRSFNTSRMKKNNC